MSEAVAPAHLGEESTGLIVGRGITVRYGSVVALDSVSFRLVPGTATALVGPNGSGKSTLLNVLAGLVPPSMGTLSGLPRTAMVCQHHHQTRWLPLSAGEVVRLGRYRDRSLLARLRSDDRTAIADACERLELTGLLRRSYGELSGGQQQRVRVALALAQEPRLLLLDEPITGLDLASQQRILEIIAEETAAGTTVVLSTHHLDEARHCDQVLLLAGRLVAAGPPDTTLTPAHLRDAYGARLLGDHAGHDHAHDLLLLDDHGHGHDTH